MRLVLDTNVVVAGVRSVTGASHALVRTALAGRCELILTTTLVLEYEDVLKRHRPDAHADVERLIDGLSAVGTLAIPRFTVRPALPDANDEMVLEAAIAGAAGSVVTHNVRDFVGARRFGVSIIKPGEALRRLNDDEA